LVALSAKFTALLRSGKTLPLARSSGCAPEWSDKPLFSFATACKARQISIAYRQEKHGTALAIELFAKNFNSLGCRISGNKSFAKGSTS
jgi:hypothetical protein